MCSCPRSCLPPHPAGIIAPRLLQSGEPPALLVPCLSSHAVGRHLTWWPAHLLLASCSGAAGCGGASLSPWWPGDLQLRGGFWCGPPVRVCLSVSCQWFYPMVGYVMLFYHRVEPRTGYWGTLCVHRLLVCQPQAPWGTLLFSSSPKGPQCAARSLYIGHGEWLGRCKLSEVHKRGLGRGSESCGRFGQTLCIRRLIGAWSLQDTG